MKTLRMRMFLLGIVAVGVTVPALLSCGVAYAEGMGEVKFIDVHGYRTRYFEAGRGEALVLVHGGSLGTTVSAEDWDSIFGRLAEHFHVYAFDKLAMGETDNPRTDEEYTMKATIDHAYGFLQQIGVQTVHLAGHSRGGLPVARIAVDHPELVKTLIIFDSNTLAPEDPSTNIDWYEQQAASQPPRILPAKIQAVKDKMELLRSRYIEANRDKVEKDPALAIIRSPSPWWLRDTKYETLDLIRAGRLKAPTLIIWGFNDPSAPVILASHLLNLIAPVVSRTQLHVFNEGTHSVYRDHPEEAASLVVNFIKNSP